MKKVLFVGNYFDEKVGTITPSRRVGVLFKEWGYKVDYVSTFVNRLLRIPNILFKAVTGRYDLFHIDVYSGNAFRIAEAVSKVAAMRGTPIAIALMGGSLPEFYVQNEDRIQNLFNRAHITYTPSSYLHTFFKENEPGTDIMYIPNMIDLSIFPAKNTYKPIKKLLWVRAFTEIYNPELPVRLIHLLQEEHPDITLTMVGPDKGLLPSVQELADKLGVKGRITYTGPIPNHQLSEVFHQHDLLLNTTSYESFGMAVLEAGSCGLPIVSTKVGELPLIWHEGEDIVFVSGISVESFAREVSVLLNDSQLAMKIGQAAAVNARRFDKESITGKWQPVIQSLKEL